MLSPVVRRRIVATGGAPFDAIARVGGGCVIALIYHRVGAATRSPVDLPLDTFRRQLDTMVERAEVIDLDTAVARLSEPSDDDRPRVVITFDDGTADWPGVVMPALGERSLPATFYVATDFVEAGRSFPDDGRPVSWPGLAEMVATGLATIGSHTHTHRVLAGVSVSEASDEIDRSVTLIEDRLGVACRHFAYPKAVLGSPAAEIVVRRRFVSATLAGNRPNRCGATDPHRIGRHALTVADDGDAFARKLGGGARLEGWLRERRDAHRAAS